MAIQDAATYIVTMDYAVHYLCNGYFNVGGTKEELQHLKEALARCKYPRWAINKVQNKVVNGN